MCCVPRYAHKNVGEPRKYYTQPGKDNSDELLAHVTRALACHEKIIGGIERTSNWASQWAIASRSKNVPAPPVDRGLDTWGAVTDVCAQRCCIV
jgi:hypothetical protein